MLDKFEQIRIKYIETFAAKQKEIEKAWDNKDVAHVHELMHKLAGSSGGYGFNELYKLVYKGMELTSNHQEFKLDEIQKCLQQIYSSLKNTYDSQIFKPNEL